MDKNIVTVNKKEIARFVQKGSKLVFTKTAENELIKLLRLKKYIDEQVDLVKQMVAEKGLSVDRKSTRLNSSHIPLPRMPSSA